MQNLLSVELAETRSTAPALAEKQMNLTKSTSKGLRNSKSSERPTDLGQGNTPKNDLSTDRLKSRKAPYRDKSKRLSRHRSASCIQGKKDGILAVVSESVAMPRSMRRTKSTHNCGSSDPQTVALQVDGDDDSKKAHKLSRKHSKRTLGTIASAATAASHQENPPRKERPRRKSSRKLSEEIKRAVEETITDSAELLPTVLPTHGDNVMPFDDREKSHDKKLTRKSSRRALKEASDTLAAVVPIPSDVKSAVDRRSTIHRTMSDRGLPEFEDGQAEKMPKGVKTPKITPMKRLQSMKKAMSLRINSRRPKNRIVTTELSPFEHHLTCGLWSDDASIVSTALMKLSSLSSTERETSLSTLEQVGSSAIIGCLRKWWYDSDVQLQGFRLLSLLANDISDRFIEGAVRCGAFEIIMNGMESSPSDQLLQEYACGAIFTLVNTECSNTSEKFISDLSALPSLLRPLLTYPANDEIQKKVRLAYNSVKRFDHLRDFLELGEPIMKENKRRSSLSRHRRSQKTEDRPNRPQHHATNAGEDGVQVPAASAT